jgi:hypothetical protein
MLAEAIDEREHQVLEGNLRPSDRNQNHPKNLVQIKPRLLVKDHLITNFEMHQSVAAQTKLRTGCFLFATQNLAIDK